MPSGCEFKCDNKECSNYNSGFTVLAPWSIGDIDKIINAKAVKKNQPFQAELIKLKESGKQYSCINYPNVDKIDKVGYRVQKWCDKCLVIWNFDAMIQNPEETAEETVEKANITNSCSKCNETLKQLTQMVEDGVPCPSCKQKLTHQVWFSNETTEEYTRNPLINKDKKNDQ